MIGIISCLQFLGLAGIEGYKFLKLYFGALGELRRLSRRKQGFFFFSPLLN